MDATLRRIQASLGELYIQRASASAMVDALTQQINEGHTNLRKVAELHSAWVKASEAKPPEG